MNTRPTNTTREDEPLSRRAMRSELERHRRSIQNWTLGAIALASLHLIQFVSIGLPWAGEPRLGDRATGWDLLADRFDSSSYALLSIVALGASTLCAGFAMSSRDRRFVSAMAACSVIRAGLVIKAVQVVGLEDWGTRSGAVIAVAAALATAVAAVMVSPTLDD